MPLVIASGVNVPPILTPAAANAAVANVQAIVAGLGTLQGASAQTLLPATIAAANTAAGIANGIDQNDSALDAFSPDGAYPFQEASWVNQMAAALTSQSMMFDTYGYVQRAADNLENGSV